MKSEQFWEKQKKELENLLKERREISKKIHLLKVSLQQHKTKSYKNPNAGKTSRAFARFGKRWRDLTPEERRLWAKERKQNKK